MYGNTWEILKAASFLTKEITQRVVTLSINLQNRECNENTVIVKTEVSNSFRSMHCYVNEVAINFQEMVW